MSAPVSSGLVIADGVPLAPLTTLGLGGAARHLIDATDESTAAAAVAWAAARGLPLVVLGGGSNVVVADAGFAGVVVRMGIRGVTWRDDGIVVAAAGEPWDAFVSAAVARGFAGVECLAGIPGLVGATPIQNVGAYGQEVAETIREVRALERATGAIVTLPATACAFGYRDSRFRRAPEDHVVLGVTFALRPGGAPTIRYRELEETLVARGGAAAGGTPAPPMPSPTLAEVSAIVRALRRKKSMVIDDGSAADPNRRSVGSFFTNPVLAPAAAAAVCARAVASGAVASADDVPRFTTPAGDVKIPAAWLCERAGFAKGFRRGAVGVSSAHALALVHHGGGSTTALVALARDIRDAVAARFGVTLAPEPIFVGAPWA